MDINECFELGSIVKPHGLKGAVSVYIDADDPSRYASLDVAFLQVNDALVPYFIEKVERKKGQHYIWYLEDINDIYTAESLSKKKVFLPLKALPPMEGNRFYFHEVIDWEVEDKERGIIGTITGFNDQTAQVLMMVRSEDDIEIIVPLLDSILQEVDRDNQIIKVELPDGLFEMYTENDPDRDQ